MGLVLALKPVLMLEAMLVLEIEVVGVGLVFCERRVAIARATTVEFAGMFWVLRSWHVTR